MLQDNFRPTQDVNGRSVYHFQPGMADSSMSSQAPQGPCFHTGSAPSFSSAGARVGSPTTEVIGVHVPPFTIDTPEGCQLKCQVSNDEMKYPSVGDMRQHYHREGILISNTYFTIND